MTDQIACKFCGAIIVPVDGATIYEAIQDHGATCPGATGGLAGRDIKDFLPPEATEDNLVGMEDVLGKRILVTELTWRDSTFKEDTQYLSLTVQVDGEEHTLNTGAERIVQAFKFLDPSHLPLYVTFEKVVTKANRRVYRLKL